jgi:hypothetical protein
VTLSLRAVLAVAAIAAMIGAVASMTSACGSAANGSSPVDGSPAEGTDAAPPGPEPDATLDDGPDATLDVGMDAGREPAMDAIPSSGLDAGWVSGLGARIPCDGGALAGSFEARRDALTCAVAALGNYRADAGGASQCYGESAFAIAALATGTHLDAANAAIEDIHDAFGAEFKDTSLDEATCHFVMPHLWRMLLDPVLAAGLTPLAREDLVDMVRSWVDFHSYVADANLDWVISGSENHDAIRWVANYLGTQILLAELGPDAGALLVPTDGLTLAQHHDAWAERWKRTFRGRAGEGLASEIDTPYNKYEFENFFAVRDFAGDPRLRAMADDYLSLLFADGAQNFVPALGNRGGGWTRWYKNLVFSGGDDELVAWFYLYGWHSAAPNPRALVTTFMPALSGYRVPGLVTALATAASRPPFQYTSRRFGMLGDAGNLYTFDSKLGADGKGYKIAFDGEGGSQFIRQSSSSREVTFGALAFDEVHSTYNGIVEQNRAMGAFFGDGERAIVLGKGSNCDVGMDAASAAGCRTGYNEVYGVAGADALLVARPKTALNVATESTGTRVFLTSGLYASKTASSGGEWLFFQTGEDAGLGAYLAIRVATGALAPVQVPGGWALDFSDLNAPVVLQFGRASAGTFAAFQSSVEGRPYAFASGTVKYTSIDGTSFTFPAYGEGGAGLPQMNGEPVDLDPPLTYDSPYMRGVHGDDHVSLSYPGYADVVLDFSP